MSMTMKELQERMARTRIDIERAVNDDLPRRIGNQVVRLTKKNFHEEGFFGKPWKEVKRRQPKKPRKGRAARSGRADTRRKILTQTGDLGRSVRDKPGKASVTIYSDLEYSRAHNEGTGSAGRGHRTAIPQRQFLGDHPTVRQAVKETIEKEIGRIMKNKQ